jgi:hypothetical protein
LAIVQVGVNNSSSPFSSSSSITPSITTNIQSDESALVLSTSSSSLISSSQSSSQFSSSSSSNSSTVPTQGSGGGGVITIGQSVLNPNNLSSVSSVSSQSIINVDLQNQIGGSLGTLSIKDLGFKIVDPYTCGGDIKGTLTDKTVKTIKYQFFKKGEINSSFVYEVPVVDGEFQLQIDYSIIPEADYKITFTGTNSNSQTQSGSFEAFVTNNCDKTKSKTPTSGTLDSPKNPKGSLTRSGLSGEEAISTVLIIVLIVTGLAGFGYLYKKE